MARPPKEISQLSPDARQTLMHAAAALFAQQGYSATGVQQITDAAGINKAMLYYYFGSKEQLYDQLVGEGIRAVEQAVSAAEAGGGALRDRLTHFLTDYITIVLQTPDLARILFREIMGGGERDRQTIVDHFSGNFRRLAAVLSAAADAGELRRMDPLYLAYSLFGMATIFIASHFVAGRTLDVPAIVNHVVELFLHGAEEPGPRN